MKIILTNKEGEVFGAFDSVEKLENDLGYLCDGAIFPLATLGEIVSQEEVADDYMTPQQIEAYNNKQKQNRANSYKEQSDALFFKAQRNEINIQEWEAKVAEIKNKYPYKEQV